MLTTGLCYDVFYIMVIQNGFLSLHLSAKKDLLGMITAGLKCSETAGPEQDLRRVKSAQVVD